MENLWEPLSKIESGTDLLTGIDLSLTKTVLIRPARVGTRGQATAVYQLDDQMRPLLVNQSTNHWMKLLAQRYHWFIERDVVPYYWALGQHQGPFPWLQGRFGFWPVASNLAGAVAWVNLAYLEGLNQYGSGTCLLIGGHSYYLPLASTKLKKHLMRLKVISWQMQIMHRQDWLSAEVAREILPWLPYPLDGVSGLKSADVRRYRLIAELGHFAHKSEGREHLAETAAFLASASEPDYQQRLQPDWWWR